MRTLNWVALGSAALAVAVACTQSSAPTAPTTPAPGAPQSADGTSQVGSQVVVIPKPGNPGNVVIPGPGKSPGPVTVPVPVGPSGGPTPGPSSTPTPSGSPSGSPTPTPTPTPTPLPLLTVTINNVASGAAYQVIRGDQTAPKMAFIDDDWVIQSSDAAEVRYIQTSVADAMATQNPFLTFTTNLPVTVWVGFDAFATIPSWVTAQGYTQSGSGVQLNSASRGASTVITYWQKVFNSAGTITLGPNAQTSSTILMYHVRMFCPIGTCQ